ncbi:MAG: hypothetical protein IIC62_00470 [Proteobacteria bacterium]|nr:hypothetical protein [Pseudomonadota bacterium]
MRLNAMITAILYTILLALPAAATADAGYAEIIKSSTIADLLSADESGSTADIAVSNDRMIGDVRALQYAFEGEVDGRSANYVITAFVNGSLAYQITTFASGVSVDVVMREANTIVDGFSFIGDAPELSGVIEQPLILQ